MKSPLVVATRIHLGNAASPPNPDDLRANVEKYRVFCTTSCQAKGLIAVDAAPKFDGYDLVQTVRKLCQEICQDDELTVVPVTPWGKFVPALNALVAVAAADFERILFVSLETTASQSAMETLFSHFDADTLVVGAALPGHAYSAGRNRQLSGRTTPWNTLAVWNLEKLALTGFLMVSEGKLSSDPSYGVEEVAATATIQKILGREKSKTKLVLLNNVEWRVGDLKDPSRQKWHEEKMNSKIERAARQLQLLGLEGVVDHC